MRLDADLQAALGGERVPKFLGTVSAAGQPNCVPITTIAPYDDETLVFGEFMMNKTRKNLLECPKVGIAVMTDSLDAWSIQGTFLGFHTVGDPVDRINTSRLFRYNAYTSIRSAGLIRVDAVGPKQTLNRYRMLWDFVCTRAAAVRRRSAPGMMPPQVMAKLARISAVRAISYVDPGGLMRTLPVMTCIAAGPNDLLIRDPLFRSFASDLASGTNVAVAVITRDPIAYQVKGVYLGCKAGFARIAVTESYSASPPLCGERLGA